MRYKVALKQTDEGYSVSVPGLPGCWSQGATEEEALANIEVAIREYLNVVDELLHDSQMREVDVAVKPCPGSRVSIISTPCEHSRRRASALPARANTSS